MSSLDKLTGVKKVISPVLATTEVVKAATAARTIALENMVVKMGVCF